MDALLYQKTLNRICEDHPACVNCPLDMGDDMTCSQLLAEFPETAVKVVEQYSRIARYKDERKKK